MKPITQTDTTFKSGNCGEACIASILEINLEDIPHYIILIIIGMEIHIVRI